jgi:O-antigen/teichoic acid export membrane protein
MTKSNSISSSLGNLRAKLLGGSGLKGHMFRGGTWMGIGSVLEQVFRMGRNMLLTRLLAPEAFGVMAIVYSTSSIVDMLAEIGVKEAIIQHPKGNDHRYINSAWWLGFGRGVGIYAILFALAPWVAKFYGNAELAPLMRTALLSIIFLGAQSSKAFVALKEMKFKRWAFIQNGGGIFGSLVVVGMAFFVRSVWALAIGFAAENFMRCIISFAICPFLPRLELDRESLKGLLTFSKGVFGLSVLNLIFARTDIFVLGKLYPAGQLGIYTMAIYLIQVPVSFIMNVLSQTLMPSFAQIQREHSRINRIVIRVTSVIVLLGMPALIFIALGSRSILSLLYGSRYASAALPLALAGVVALLNLMNGIITMVFYATGVPQFHRRCVFIMAVLMIVLIYPAAKEFGMVGGQIAALFAVAAGYASQLVRMKHLTQLDFARYMKSFPLPIVVSCAVFVVFLVIRHVVVANGLLMNLILGMLAFILALSISGRVFLKRQMAEAPTT